MDEKLIKKKLIDIFSKDFDIIEKIQGESFYGKKVRPDLGLRLKGHNALFLVEIKDDTTKNFQLSHLLRQAITYKFAKYNNEIPLYCFVVTASMIIGKFNIPIYQDLFGLANRLGIGRISIHKRNYIQASSEMLELAIGGNILYKYHMNTKYSLIDFKKMPSIMIGTKSSSNKIKHSLKPKQCDFLKKEIRLFIIAFFNFCKREHQEPIISYARLPNLIQKFCDISTIEASNIKPIFLSLLSEMGHERPENDVRDLIPTINWDNGFILNKIPTKAPDLFNIID